HTTVTNIEMELKSHLHALTVNVINRTCRGIYIWCIPRILNITTTKAILAKGNNKRDHIGTGGLSFPNRLPKAVGVKIAVPARHHTDRFLPRRNSCISVRCYGAKENQS